MSSLFNHRAVQSLLTRHSVRYAASGTTTVKALVLGAYEGSTEKHPILSELSTQLSASYFQAKPKEVRLFYDVHGYDVLAIVGLGGSGEITSESQATANPLHSRERAAASEAMRQIRNVVGSTSTSPPPKLSIEFEHFTHPKATAEGAQLGTFSFEQFKQKKQSPTSYTLFPKPAQSLWSEGLIFGQAQNIARELEETPANLMTPTLFCERAKHLLASLDHVELYIRDMDWIKKQGMGSFLSVSQGSDQPPKFLELIYKGDRANDKKITALIGKGVTFDSGGISIKPSTDMAVMKGDMGGAATTLSAFWGAAKLGLPINLVAVMPLTENLLNGNATKPGDIVTARNGLTIEVDNTDAEGRLILADAIHYVASTYTPAAVVELSTLTGAMDVALGHPYAGVFTNNDALWIALQSAGQAAGDPFWRMPLSEEYDAQIKSHVADLKNIGGRSAGSCTAAIFLKHFLPDQNLPFAHIDIAGVFHTSATGMTGRPTRALLQYLAGQSESPA